MENKKHKFNYNWNLKDAVFTKDKGKVFSCFACGGGSTMGYKLAGFDVIGHNDIDKKMIEVYKENHKPKFSFLESITTFAKRKDLPKELYELDILDGSPPCSSFSMAGNREKDWGKEKIFREGQELQVLDTLFFDFIDLAKELKPKVVVAENVSGLMMGNAKEYVKKIYIAFKEAGYELRIEPYLLDASTMGVPQRRRRVFFVAIRTDLSEQFMEQVDMFQVAPKLDLEFNEKEIVFSEFADYSGPNITEYAKRAWDVRIESDSNIAESKKRVPGMKVSDMNTGYVFDNKVCQTLTSKGNCGSLLYSKPIRLSKNEFCNIGSFPQDYNFTCNFGYLIGMSVPPVMTAQIASNIYDQWLSKI
jgi:DNA (cytosine-5)-methyltransferase 1